MTQEDKAELQRLNNKEYVHQEMKRYYTGDVLDAHVNARLSVCKLQGKNPQDYTFVEEQSWDDTTFKFNTTLRWMVRTQPA